MREEAEDAEPVVDRDEHDALAGKRLAVVTGFGAAAGLEPAAVNPDHDRQTCRPAGAGGAKMLSVRQSSLISANEMSANILPCMHAGPGLDASRTPVHGAAG